MKKLLPILILCLQMARAAILTEYPASEFTPTNSLWSITVTAPSTTPDEIIVTDGVTTSSANHNWNVVAHEEGYVSVNAGTTLSLNRNSGLLSFAIGSNSVSITLSPTAREFSEIWILAKTFNSPGWSLLETFQIGSNLYEVAAKGFYDPTDNTWVSVTDIGDSLTMASQVNINNLGEPGWIADFKILGAAPTPSPEPGSITLLATGGLMFIGRRRRTPN